MKAALLLAPVFCLLAGAASLPADGAAEPAYSYDFQEMEKRDPTPLGSKKVKYVGRCENTLCTLYDHNNLARGSCNDRIRCGLFNIKHTVGKCYCTEKPRDTLKNVPTE